MAVKCNEIEHETLTNEFIINGIGDIKRNRKRLTDITRVVTNINNSISTNITPPFTFNWTWKNIINHHHSIKKIEDFILFLIENGFKFEYLTVTIFGPIWFIYF